VRVAAIDIGTNSCHLVVADVGRRGEVSVVHQVRDQVELGRGTLGRNELTEDAMRRGIETLISFRKAMDVLGVEAIECSATSAVREAKNGNEFCRRVREATDIHVRIVSGVEEARLIWMGVRPHLDPARGPAVLVDIGGGSVEVVLCDAHRLITAHSLPLGHIRLSESVTLSDPPTDDEIWAVRKLARRDLDRVGDIRPGLGTMYGTSGSIRTLARMAVLAAGQPEPQHEHGLVLERSALKALLQTFQVTRSSRLTELPGMDPRRRGTLVTAAAVLYQIMKSLDAPELVTSEHALREGLLADWVDRHRPELRHEVPAIPPRMRAVLRLRDRYGTEPQHAEQVRRLAMALFDGMVGLHGLDQDARALLEQAALLHDIGHHIDPRDHEKHGQYLVLHSRMAGFTAPDLAVLSNLVRYHRGPRPKQTHRQFAALSKVNQRRVEVLSAILQVADALDRSHQQPIGELRVRTTGDGVQVEAHTDADEVYLERWSSERRASVLETVLGRSVELTFVVQGTTSPGKPPGRSPSGVSARSRDSREVE
jgi:exopolyphosphatase/guanosine-5'-triphosphate,3'-diphosphate pyrophosphatase